jgi:hypothetical protein
MFRALERFIKSKPDGLEAFLTVEYAVYDWTWLGLFTCSRVAEYAQTRLKSSDRFNSIPTTLDAGPWAGQALAFLWANFVFYTAQHELIPLSCCTASFLPQGQCHLGPYPILIR